MRARISRSLLVPMASMAVAGTACSKKDTATADPGATTARSSPRVAASPIAGAASASAVDVAKPLPSGDPAGAWACEDGRLVASAAPRPAASGTASTIAPGSASGNLFGEPVGDAFGQGGLGLSGTGVGGGRGDGIGLGSIGSIARPGASSSAGIGLGSGAGRVGLGRRSDSSIVARLSSPTGAAGEPISRAMCALVPAMRACVSAASSDASPVVGAALVTITLGSDGSVTKTVATVEKGGTPSLVTCLERTLEGKTFAAGTPTIVYRLDLAWRPMSVKMKEGATSVTGRLPPEVIKRILRANFPRFRFCYEKLRVADPSAEGTVVTSFLIDEKGEVTSAKNDGGTIADATMRSCVAAVIKTLAFPEPEAGKVRVSYPLSFSYE